MTETPATITHAKWPDPGNRCRPPKPPIAGVETPPLERALGVIADIAHHSASAHNNRRKSAMPKAADELYQANRQITALRQALGQSIEEQKLGWRVAAVLAILAIIGFLT